jgi:hypothetical protein
MQKYGVRLRIVDAAHGSFWRSGFTRSVVKQIDETLKAINRAVHAPDRTAK